MELTNHTSTPTPALDYHCRRPQMSKRNEPMCSCEHIICYRGWIDHESEGTTSPCQWCRPELHARWIKAAEARQKDYPLESVNRILAGRDPHDR